MKYVAFLRGINVGGVTIKMEALKKAFIDAGFENIKTVLASGNVLFDAKYEGEKSLTNIVEEQLEKTFNRKIHVLVRSYDDIKQLVASDPFKGVSVTPQTRLYVTFLSPTSLKSNIKAPFEAEGGDFKILKITETEVCCVITISDSKNTTDLMSHLEKEFGKAVTTRNWNTVLKVSSL